MAYSYIWPSGLPQVVEKGYSESIGFNVTRTPMDLGPPKIRRRSRRPDILSISFLMTTTQVALLETFINTTINATARFGFPHPRKGTISEVRIVPTQDGTYFNLQYRAPGYFGVSMQLEILP